ncbi:RlmE family RNA methyltransferase [soil metagenome]
MYPTASVMTRPNPYKRPDRFTVEAKKAGFPARSVFKLEEIDRRLRLIRPGMHVLDLGSSPGSWSLYVAKHIGAKGKLLSIDLNPLGVALPEPAIFIQGDALALTNDDLATFAPYDVVLSDMAPKTTGNRLGDQTRSFELYMHALDVAAAHCKPGGAFVGKIFMGEDLPLARTEVKKHFAKERILKPESSRSVSYEIFLVGEGKKST